MKIIYFNNGAGLGKAKSGGTARHIETARRLIEAGVGVYIVTTEGALDLYKREHLDPKQFIKVKANLFKQKETSNFDRAVSYLVSSLHSLMKISKLPKADIVYSPSDYFCDLIPGIFYKLHHKSKLVVMIHHVCKSPLKRKGNFLLNLVSYLGQRFDYFLTKKYADKLLVYDTPEGEKIAHMIFGKVIPENKVSFVFNGLNFSEISETPQTEKIYDVCFAGGLRYTKGIYDIVPVWSRVCDYFPEAVLLVAGGGTEKVTQDLQRTIKTAGLEENVILAGSLDSKTLYQTLKQSKVFISLSHEEGWGISVAEALAAGLPVVAFDLPAFRYLEDNIIRVEKFDYDAMAQGIINFLKDEKLAEMMAETGKKFIQRYSWDKIARMELDMLKNMMKEVSV